MRAFHNANKTSVLSDTKMVISFGVGVVGKHGVVQDMNNFAPVKNRLSLPTIRQSLKTRSPSRDIEAFLKHSSQHIDDNHESLQSWRQAYQNLHSWAPKLRSSSSLHSDAPLCPDHELSLELITPSQLVISNLHGYFRSSSSDLHRESCVMSLLSHFVSTYVDVIGDIRLRFPKYPNNHFNKGIVQTRAYVENNYPYHDVGLDGTGQIIGVGDTGIDELSCFFRNSDSSLVTRSTISNPTFDLSKRKVIQYISYADGQDLEGGHGTHVSGTVAGSSEGFVSAGIKYGGHASGAKIAFFDMELSSSPNSGFYIPSPMAPYVFQPAYDAGARIHSNSWGSPLNEIDDDDLTVDSFQYWHDDFLAVFAAGNDGSEGFYSIGQPATTKNSISVGASRSESSDEISRVAYFSSLGPTFDERIKVCVFVPSSSMLTDCLFCSRMSLVQDTTRRQLMPFLLQHRAISLIWLVPRWLHLW